MADMPLPSPSILLSPLTEMGGLRDVSRALRGQDAASPLDLTGLGEVLNELENLEGEAALERSDSALLLVGALVSLAFTAA